MSTTSPPRGFTTSILHSDRSAEIEHGALHKPLHLSVAYGYRDARDLVAVFQGRMPGYAYGRQGNPTSAALEAKVTGWSRAWRPCASPPAWRRSARRCSRSWARRPRRGQPLSLRQHGEHAQHPRRPRTGGDVRRRHRRRQRGGGADPATRVVFVETIANPRMQVADLERIGALCRDRGILYVVDNTMTSPALFRPKRVGAGLVVNALTKYIGGHGNALAGSITDTGLFDWSRYPNIADSYKTQKPELWGITADPQEGAARLGRHLAPSRPTTSPSAPRRSRCGWRGTCANALAVAELLAATPEVRAVYYPGLPSPSAACARPHAVRRLRRAAFVRARRRRRSVSNSSIA